jgi:hypothetical protein
MPSLPNASRDTPGGLGALDQRQPPNRPAMLPPLERKGQ